MTDLEELHFENGHSTKKFNCSKYSIRILGKRQGNNFLEQLFFRMISVDHCSRDKFPLGIACDNICSKIIFNLSYLNL